MKNTNETTNNNNKGEIKMNKTQLRKELAAIGEVMTDAKFRNTTLVVLEEMLKTLAIKSDSKENVADVVANESKELIKPTTQFIKKVLTNVPYRIVKSLDGFYELVNHLLVPSKIRMEWLDGEKPFYAYITNDEARVLRDAAKSVKVTHSKNTFVSTMGVINVVVNKEFRNYYLTATHDIKKGTCVRVSEGKSVTKLINTYVDEINNIKVTVSQYKKTV